MAFAGDRSSHTNFDLTMGPARPRLPVIDVARGIALAAMIVYHFAWDLSFLGFISTDVTRQPAWIAFARSIAGSFLFLVGIGLVLADEAKQSWGSYLRRLGKIAAAAAAITLATYIAMPDAFIFFGILHMIAVGSILALPFLRAPAWLTIAIATIVMVLPRHVGWSAFDPVWLAWTGLYATPPVTNDFEPVLPWFGPVLLGVAAGRLMVDRGWREGLSRIRAAGFIGRGLAAMGRWSLVIYLIHQPILLAFLYPLALWQAPPPRTFIESCIGGCAGTGADAAYCSRACGCIEQSLVEAGDGHILTAARVTPEEQARVDDVTRQCFRREWTGGNVTPAPLPETTPAQR